MSSDVPNEPTLPAEVADESFADSHAEEFTAAELEQLIEEYSSEASPAKGEIRTATVVKVTADGVVVDLGLKSEGLVPLPEFSDEQGQPTIQPGETIEVLLEGSQTREGYIPCSSEGAHRLKLWDEVEGAFQEKSKLRCKAVERIKGGLLVEINLAGAHPGRRPLGAFLPGSQVDVRPVRHWEGFLGRELYCRVLRLNRRRGNIVVSRRLLLEEEQEQRRKLLEEVIKEGAVLTGTVKNLTDYGAFIDLGGLDGLLHISDISYRRLSHPSEALAPEDEVRVKILKVDRARERISLGMKQLETDPWQEVEKKYPAGERVRGRVSHLVDYGAFVELEPGLEGLIHISEMSWTKRVRHPKDLLKDGDWVEAVVLDLQPGEQRLSLGLRQTQPDPFQTAPQRYPAGRIVKGRVRSLTEFGAFVELEPGIEGMIHRSELSWDKSVKKPAQVLKRGQDVRAKVLKVDAANRRVSLSLKDLTPDPWANYVGQAQEGQVVRGRVVRRTNFGAFVELAPGVEGLCHVSELPDDPEQDVKVGEEYEFKVLKVSAGERRISLSLRSLLEQQRREKYGSAAPRGTATLEEILTAKGFNPGTGKT
ncbi:MAG: 30S ribosomal protein S1 [Acidobacteria bacterium]|nr:30S ribosomal protein S1 [Acidobacteriota bacterium]